MTFAKDNLFFGNNTLFGFSQSATIWKLNILVQKLVKNKYPCIYCLVLSQDTLDKLGNEAAALVNERRVAPPPTRHYWSSSGWQALRPTGESMVGSECTVRIHVAGLSHKHSERRRTSCKDGVRQCSQSERALIHRFLSFLSFTLPLLSRSIGGGP